MQEVGLMKITGLWLDWHGKINQQEVQKSIAKEEGEGAFRFFKKQKVDT